MSGPRVDQLLAAAHAGDATGDAAMALATRVRRAGWRADVFALSIDDDMSEHVRTLDELPDSRPIDTTILHFNIPSPLAGVLSARSGRRVMVYHNLTPPELLLPYLPEVARLTALGRRQLAELAESRTVDLAVGVSEYNTADLERAGFDKTATLPLPLDLARLQAPVDPVLNAELEGTPMPTFITVGRVAPNKRVEDFLKTAAYYLRYINPEARFIVVGGTRGLEAYLDALVELHGELKLDSRVTFSNKVSLTDLITYYRHATAYVCTSVHEGFCAPLIEAMTLGVPIVARRAAAIPETLGGAGVLVESSDPAEWAEMLGFLAHDHILRDALSAGGTRRLADFETDIVLDRWMHTLDIDNSP